jgi:hypothetical protein
VVTLAVLLVFDRPLVVGDGIAYLIWLDSVALDGDLDLENQAAKFAAVNTYHIYLNERSGRWASAFPLGVALLLAPFYRIGAWLDNMPYLRVNDAHFVGIQAVPLAYSLSTMVGANLYALLTVGLGYGVARRFTGPWLAGLAAVAVYLGTPLLFYSTVEPLNSHLAGAFAATLFVFLWLRERDRTADGTASAVLPWLAIGLVAGLAALSRWQVALLALPVGAELLLRRRWLQVVVMAAGFALLAWIIPYSWWRMFGSTWVVPAAARDGSTFLFAPVHTWRVLTSPIAGLFPWSPIALLALLGLIPLWQRGRSLALVAMAMFVLEALVSGSVRDWWAGSGFGMRRMAELYPIYAMMLAALLGATAVGPRWFYGLALAATLACALYGVALLVAHLNYVWTNPWGLARDTPLKELRYAFSREHWPLTWPVIKDHVGPWAWKKPGP